MRAALRVLALLVAAVSLAATLRVAFVSLEPISGHARVAAQVAWLNGQRAGDAPQRMQRLFPEGAFFTHVLTGLAAGSVHDLATVNDALQASADPGIKDRFGTIAALDGGTFYRGWRLLLLTEQARLSGSGTDALLGEARTIQQALTDSPTGVPASYPNGYWPCDAVVAMAAVVRARELAGDPIDSATLAGWLARINQLRDPGTGLLAHRVGADGTLLEPARGSSQSLIQAYWRDVDPSGAAGQWQAFVRSFVVSEVGLVGVREFPIGQSGGGDEDSGPLIFGVSASASAVTLAAARRNGDVELATSLDREAEYLGLPLELPDGRRFAFGLMPVGDAFVAWARGMPVSAAQDSQPASALTPWWWAHAALTLLPGLLAAWLWWGLRRRRTVAD